MVGHFFLLSIIFYILSNLFVFYAFKINNLFKFQFKPINYNIYNYFCFIDLHLLRKPFAREKNIQNQNIAGINVVNLNFQ